MALTAREEQRLRKAELAIERLWRVVQGASSRNMLNRLHVLCKEELDNVVKRTTDLEAEVKKVLALARKVQ